MLQLFVYVIVEIVYIIISSTYCYMMEIIASFIKIEYSILAIRYLIFYLGGTRFKVVIQTIGNYTINIFDVSCTTMIMIDQLEKV